MQLPLRYAWLHGYIPEVFVEIDDVAEAAEIEYGAAVHRRDARTIAPIFSAADWIKRCPEPVGDPQTLLHLIPVAGPQKGGNLPGSREGGDLHDPARGLIRLDKFDTENLFP